MTKSGDVEAEKAEREHRTFVNLATVIAVLLLAAGCYWVLKSIDEKRRLENCVNAGRRNCTEMVEPKAQ